MPPWKRYRVLERHGTIHDGDVVRIRIDVGGLPVAWVAEHSGFERNAQFVDRTVRGPVRRWVHTHRFFAEGPASSAVEDTVEYDAPFGPLGEAVVRRHLTTMFEFRHRRTVSDLVRQAEHGGGPALRIAVTGAGGLVGRELVPFLATAGHRVERVVRRRPAGSDEIGWDPQRGEIEADRFEGVDAVVHLAGASIRPPYTRQRRRLIAQSRVEGTRLLSRTLASLRRPPRVLVSAAGAHYYGDRGADVLVESEPPGEGYWASMGADWEAATTPASDAGIRVVTTRNGVVLSGHGGALRAMYRLFRFGVGGRLGDGEQWVSWICADDLVGAIYRAIHDERLDGAVNAVAPNPVTNRELTETLGRVLRRPTPLGAPAWAISAVPDGGVGSELVLSSVRALPGRLAAVGHRFEFPTLEDCLRFQLGRARSTEV